MGERSRVSLPSIYSVLGLHLPACLGPTCINTRVVLVSSNLPPLGSGLVSACPLHYVTPLVTKLSLRQLLSLSPPLPLFPSPCCIIPPLPAWSRLEFAFVFDRVSLPSHPFVVHYVPSLVHPFTFHTLLSPFYPKRLPRFRSSAASSLVADALVLPTLPFPPSRQGHPRAMRISTDMPERVPKILCLSPPSLATCHLTMPTTHNSRVPASSPIYSADRMLKRISLYRSDLDTTIIHIMLLLCARYYCTPRCNATLVGWRMYMSLKYLLLEWEHAGPHMSLLTTMPSLPGLFNLRIGICALSTRSDG